MGRSPISLRKLILLTLNLASTLLTLLTGLRENPVIVFVSGRYDHIRSRLMGGTINYDIVRADALVKSELTDLKVVGESFRFISSPRRSPENLGEDRSTCVRVNSMNATMMAIYYDDFWGKSPRRTQIFMYSISAPHCQVINFQPSWYQDECVTAYGNASACHQYILNHFDQLLEDRIVQVGVEKDFGVPGVAMLKCIGRPERQFEYYTDLMVQQQFWAGGSFHVEIQTSKCLATSLLRNDDWKWGLFRVDPPDHAATVVSAVDNTGWFVMFVTTLYGLVTITMIVQGILAAVLRLHTVKYLPEAVRFPKEWRLLKYVFPFMSAARVVTDNLNRIITFKGTSFMASDVWMNHWLYIMLSILDSVVSIRAMYMVLEMGTWMLTKQINFENFIFMCSAITRLTWLMCFVHSMLRFACKLALRSLKTLKFFRTATLERVEWFIDAWALFLSYKIYSILVCLVFACFLQFNGSTSLMKREKSSPRSVFGGDANITQFWGNEIMCDTMVIVPIVLVAGLLFSTAMLHTKYRNITKNGVIRVLQERYAVVGWDVFVTMEALGIDPFHPDMEAEVEGSCRTNCSLGALLQQFYTSGLSGYVTLAADYLFLENGFSKEPLKLRYPIKRAIEMGLCENHHYSVTSAKVTIDDSTSVKRDTIDESRPVASAPLRNAPNGKSLFERRIRLVSEGYTGKIIFVDEDYPGRMVKASTASSLMEYEVQDALTTMSILDIKPLLGNQKKLRIH